jgi:hypothetical protein
MEYSTGILYGNKPQEMLLGFQQSCQQGFEDGGI